MAETLDHLALKKLAVAWLWRLGCRVVATEVRCPIGRYRIDVAGWFDRPIDGLLARADREAASLWSLGDESRRSPSRGPEGWRTIIIECKQSRADFARDQGEPDELLAERERLEAKRKAFEESKVKRFEPELRQQGSSLFSEMESWDFAKSKLASYRAILRDLERVNHAIYGETKFARFARYRLADRLILFAPAGLVRPKEVPTGWGLVECHRRPLRRTKADLAQGVEPDAPLPLRELVPPPALTSHPARRDRLFRTIAMAASREAVRRLTPDALRVPVDEDEAAADAAPVPIDSSEHGPGSSVG
jgi:hypothetical protein